MFRAKYKINRYISLIFRYKSRVLLFRISKNYPICPGDWEWFTIGERTLKEKQIIDKDLNQFSSEQLTRTAERMLKIWRNILKNPNPREIIPVDEPFRWDDDRFRLTYEIYPIQILVDREFKPDLSGSEKFSTWKWIDLKEISKLKNRYLLDSSKFFISRRSHHYAYR